MKPYISNAEKTEWELSELRAELQRVKEERDLYELDGKKCRASSMQFTSDPSEIVCNLGEQLSSAQKEIERLKDRWHRATLGKDAQAIIDLWVFEGGLSGDPSLGAIQGHIQGKLSSLQSELDATKVERDDWKKAGMTIAGKLACEALSESRIVEATQELIDSRYSLRAEVEKLRAALDVIDRMFTDNDWDREMIWKVVTDALSPQPEPSKQEEKR